MKKLAAACVMVAGLGITTGAQQETGPLAAARDLYASARYDEALTVLNGLRVGDHAHRRSVEQYRSLCLLALGRAGEAESAIASLVAADPLYRPTETDASPRVRATFTGVRRRLLPEIATAKYVEAKGTYDRGEWAAAERQFELVLALIDDPEMSGRMSDLRMLTTGFLELSARAAAPAPVPAPAAPPPAPAVAVKDTPAPARVEPALPGPDRARVYLADDAGVSAPGVIRQELPAVPSSLVAMARPRGVVEVVIDEQGRVTAIAIRGSIHPAYDAQLLTAARDWKYTPATLAGQPIKFRKLIQVVVKR